MKIQLNKPITMFHPRPSSGRFWLVLMAVILIAIGIAPALSLGLTSSNTVIKPNGQARDPTPQGRGEKTLVRSPIQWLQKLLLPGTCSFPFNR
jgi:hypothetical protein